MIARRPATPSSTSPALQEWRRDWKAPLVAMIGSGATTVHFATLGIFIKPIQAATGWSLSTITASVMIYAVVALVGTPLVGQLLDRQGAGKIACYGIVAYLLSLAGVGLLPHSPLQWWMIWTVVAVAGLFVRSPVWTLPVAKRFDRSRGMALALIGSGLGLFSIFMPSVTQFLVTSLDWRRAYVAVAALVAVIAIPPVWALFGRKDFDATSDARAIARMPLGGLPGPTWQTAVRGRFLWQLVAASLMVGAGIYGIQVHLVPMLQEKAMPPGTVAVVVGALGVSALLGRMVTGYLLDHFSGRLIGAVTFLLPAISCGLYLHFNGNIAEALAIVVVFGFSAGAESDVLAVLTTRYLGLRSFGVCFGIVAALMGLGGGVGPFVTARLHEFYGDYDGAMKLLVLLLIVGALMIATLGPVPDFGARRADDPGQDKAHP